MRFRPIVTVALLVCAPSCDHTAPFTVDDPEPLGPWRAAPPVRLTFNVGDDRHPTAYDDLLAFSRLEAGRSDFDRCLATLPLGGGTLRSVACAGKVAEDSILDAIIEPSLSSDGRVAFVRDRGVPFRKGTSSRHLVVAPLDSLDAPTAEYTVSFAWPDGRRVLALQQMAWHDQGVLRFIAGQETFPSDPTLPDTLFVPFGIAEFSLETGALAPMSGTDSARTFVGAPSGGIWFVRESAPDTLLEVDQANTVPVPVGVFSGPVAFLAVVDGQPVGALATDPAAVEWLDLATGLRGGTLAVPGEVGRIVGVSGSRRLVAEIAAGGSSDLWLLELP